MREQLEVSVKSTTSRKQEMKQREAQLLRLSNTEKLQAMADIRHKEVMDCYYRNNGNVSKTVRELGKDRSVVYQHLKKEGIASK